MKARCPQCGLVYPRTFTFCKKDGALLIPRRRLWPYFLLSGVVLTAIAAAILVSVGVPSYITKHFSAHVSGAGVHVQGATPYPELAFRISNSAPVSASLHSISSTCSVSGTQIADVNWKPENGVPMPLPANGSADLRTPLNLHNLGFGQLIGLSSGNGQLDCSGSAVVSVLGVKFTQKLDYNSRLW